MTFDNIAEMTSSPRGSNPAAAIVIPSSPLSSSPIDLTGSVGDGGGGGYGGGGGGDESPTKKQKVEMDCSLSQSSVPLSQEDEVMRTPPPLPSTAGNGRNEHDDEDAKLCCVCLAETKSHAFIPCGHRACCEGCGMSLKNNGHACPVCRREIQGCLRIFD